MRIITKKSMSYTVHSTPTTLPICENYLTISNMEKSSTKENKKSLKTYKTKPLPGPKTYNPNS
jgi:hypothetical protein